MKKLVLIMFLSVMVLFVGAACAQEVLLGSYSLQKAEDDSFSMKYIIQDVSRLTEESQLIVREARSWDLNDTKLLVAMDFWEKDIQLWLFDINEGFQYGYQLDTSTSSCDRMNAWLSPEGTILLYLGEETVLGFPPAVETVDDIQEYQVPESIRHFQYKHVASSQYGVSKAKDGIFEVRSPDGEKITVYDYSVQYTEYLQLLRKETRWFYIFYFPYLFLVVFLAAKLVKHLLNERQTTDTHFRQRDALRRTGSK